MYVDKSAVGRLGQTMRLNPNKSSSRKSWPVPEKLHYTPHPNGAEGKEQRDQCQCVMLLLIAAAFALDGVSWRLTTMRRHQRLFSKRLRAAEKGRKVDAQWEMRHAE